MLQSQRYSTTKKKVIKNILIVKLRTSYRYNIKETQK